MIKLHFRKRTITLSIIVLAFASILFVAQQAQAQGGLTKIADNVYSYVDIKNGSPKNSYGANAGIIIGTDGIIVIDTLISSKEAKRFIKDIRAVTDKPVKWVVNTHYHLDHAFGNAEFVKLGATVISHDICRRNLKNRGEAALKNAGNYGLTEEDMEGTEISYPGITFPYRMELDTGNQIVQLIYPGPSHTDGSILVYLPESRILFSGDILFTDYHPFLAEGDIGKWIKVLDRIMTMDIRTIIPGHGPVSGKQDITDMKYYLLAFDKKAKELAAISTDAKYITDKIIKSLPWRPEGQGLVPANIQMKYIKAKQ
ncbi:MAG: MBL fold metallo-hydrolase [Nitrospirota bacterium]